MAEFVQQSVEEMLPELEQMQRIQLFSAAETRIILKKRKAFEYKLRKTIKEKKDYVKYITYEMHVLALVKKRRKEQSNTQKRKEIDISIVQRIHKLYRLACMRFPEDVSLWLSHIGFCKSRNEMATVGQLFTNLLKIHSHKSGLWIMAAQWEMEMRLSMESARSLLQRALRFNGEDRQLWIEYYRMELLNAEKLRKREEVLGLAEESEGLTKSAVHNGEIARIVYNNALEQIPDVEFCASFLPVCRKFDFTEPLIEDIFLDLRTRFSNHEIALAIVAKRPLHELDRIVEAGHMPTTEGTRELITETFKLFDEAVERLPSERMWDLYLEMCLAVVRQGVDQQLNTELIERTHQVFTRAISCQKLSVKMGVSWIELLVEIGQLDCLLETTSTLCTLHKKSIPLWICRLRILALINSKQDLILSEIDKALVSIEKVDESVAVWKLAVEWCMSSDTDQLVTLFERGLRTKIRAVAVYIKSSYLDWSAASADIHTVRKLYKRLLAIPPITVELFNKYIAAELSQVKPKMKKIRIAYEAILQQFGSTDIDVWLNYMKLEMSSAGGEPERVGQLHWTASKSLDSGLLDEFNSRYSKLMNSRNISQPLV